MLLESFIAIVDLKHAVEMDSIQIALIMPILSQNEDPLTIRLVPRDFQNLLLQMISPHLWTNELQILSIVLAEYFCLDVAVNWACLQNNCELHLQTPVSFLHCFDKLDNVSFLKPVVRCPSVLNNIENGDERPMSHVEICFQEYKAVVQIG